MSLMLRSVAEIAPLLDDLSWTVEHERKGRFITSDTPLAVGRQPTERDEYEGVGVGSADEVRFPLDPTKQLVLSRKERAASCRVGSGRAEACNLDIAARRHKFLVGHPSQAQRINSLPLGRHRPVLRFDTGPLYEHGPDGDAVYKGGHPHVGPAAIGPPEGWPSRNGVPAIRLLGETPLTSGEDLI